MSATHAATPSTIPARRRFERFREDPVPSSIHRPPSSEDCSAPLWRPVLHRGTPLVGSKPTVALHPHRMRVPEQSYRRCERASRVRIRIRKIRYGASDQGEIDLSGTQESGPPRRLEQDPGGRPGLRRVLAETGLEHRGELVDVPEPPAGGVLEHAAEEWDRPAGLGQGLPVDSGIGEEAAAPPLGEQHLAGSSRHQPEEPGVGQPAQKGPVADPAVGEGRGEGVRVGATTQPGNGLRQGQRGFQPIGDRAVQRARHT